VSQYEYAVVDQNGQMMGMPVRSFSSQVGASGLRDLLLERIEAMRKSALQAQTNLDNGASFYGKDLSADDKAMCREMIETFESNKDNTYTVVKRLVGSWETVA